MEAESVLQEAVDFRRKLNKLDLEKVGPIHPFTSLLVYIPSGSLTVISHARCKCVSAVDFDPADDKHV